MLFYRRLFFLLLMLPTQVLSSHAEKDIFEQPFITHIKFMPCLPFFVGMRVRLYLPNKNFLDCELDTKPVDVNLDFPINPSQKTIEYYSGPPYTFVNPEETEIVVKENGLLTGAVLSFWIPGEGGPFERDASGRLWPSDFPVDQMTSTLELALSYDEKSGNYAIKSQFIP